MASTSVIRRPGENFEANLQKSWRHERNDSKSGCWLSIFNAKTQSGKVAKEREFRDALIRHHRVASRPP